MRPRRSKTLRTRLAVSITALLMVAAVAVPASGQVISPPFDASYSSVDLGTPPDVPGPLGGLTIKAATTDRLLIGGAANTSSGALYEIGVTRDRAGHINGFAGTATRFADAPNNDGGLSYAPNGALLYTRFPTNELGQIGPGSATTDRIVALTPLGVTSSVGALAFVPPGLPGEGSLKIVSYSAGTWYDADAVGPDDAGLYDIANVTQTAALNPVSGPEGIVYIAAGSPQFSAPSALISEFDAGTVGAFDVDLNGDPIVGTRRNFLTLTGAEGAFIDPATGDFLFSTFEGGDRVVVVRGFVPTAPVLTLTAPADGAVTADTTPTYSGAARNQPGDSDVVVRVFAGTVTTGTPVQTLTALRPDTSWSVDGTDALADGTYTACAEQTDSDDNTGLSNSATFRIDTTAPGAPTIAGPGLTNDPSPTFTFTSDEPGSTFQCSIDEGPFTGCESPLSTATLAQGDHTLAVQATDAAGNTGPPANRAFTIDTSAPAVTITDGPAPVSADQTPMFTFSSDETGLTFECRVDEEPFTSCRSPLTTATLAPGTHAFEVRARDGAGNVATARRAFTVDTSAPQASIDSGPGSTNNPTPTFTFSSDEPGATFQCSVDDGPFTSCESPLTTAALAPGDHTLLVRATDAAGNTGAVASRTFTVDTSSPQVTLTSGPTIVAATQAPTFTFTANEPGTVFECRIDSAPFTDCASPLTTGTLAPGGHVLEVRARDAAGNTGAPVRHEFFVAGLVTSSVLDPDGDTIPGNADNCPDVANRTQTDVDRDRIGDACDRSDASGGPALAKTVIATVVTGDVYVRYPAGFKPRQAAPAGGAPAGFVPLKGAEVLPVGSIVDTLKGRVAVDSVGGSAATSGGPRKTQTSDFYRGVFQIKQARAKKPVTDILLRSPDFAKDCSAGAATKGARAASARSKKVVSRLWGNGKGNFRTRARNSTATVRGTIWLTEERCEGSFTRVQRGIVTVRDLRRNRTFTVRAGRGYLARAARVSAKKSTTRRP